jgi:cadmium resistance protein CadD (predicted permease)
LAVGLKQLFHSDKGENVQQQKWSHLGMIRIALLIFSNGADNIGVYLPFFLIGRAYLSAILTVHAFLIASWCLIAKWFGNHPTVLRHLDRRAHWIMPAVLISLGVYILNS